jgi:predicted regulator of Ras-like GTPase activity (Roadblock/LC7/MglB family)
MAKGKINEILEDFKKEVPGFISTDVVTIADGLSVGGGSIDPKFDASIASAYYATVASAYIKTCHAIDATMEPEDLLITTDKLIIIVRVLANQDYFHGLAITPDSNLGMCRLVMKKYEDAILKAL